jgi:GNAT superfamily N-acetyltransferase
MTALTIRPATAADSELILQFVHELAAYEKAGDEVLATEEHVRQTLFCANPSVLGLICQAGTTPVGFAVYFFNYSTWQGRHGLYLEDLYVAPAHRGLGAGKAMLRHLAQTAVDRDCGRFEWSVLDWNAPAIAFYDRLGARPQAEWIRYRLTGQALLDLARS